MLFSYAESHIGQRKVNEDSYLIDKELGLYIVADGVGGLDKGEVASDLACKTIHEYIIEGLTLEESVYKAHRAIINEVKSDKGKKGMATTVVALLFNENTFEICWVGDSRVYLWDDELKLLTKDDSYVELLLENGHISLAELDTHPDRNVISQALGIERKNIIINHNSGTLCDNQLLMVCSDGLYTVAKELDIINTVTQTHDVKEISTKLVSTSVLKQGRDNITLITIGANELKCPNSAVKAKVYREYDPLTGKTLGVKTDKEISNDDLNDVVDEHEVVDPELFDRTELKDLTVDEVNLISAATKTNQVVAKKSNPYIFPAILVSIITVIGVLVLR